MTFRGSSEDFREGVEAFAGTTSPRTPGANLSAASGAKIGDPEKGAPGKTRPLGIPSVYDRVCQQALANRLEPIFEKVFDPSSFGYRKGRKELWPEVGDGVTW